MIPIYSPNKCVQYSEWGLHFVHDITLCCRSFTNCHVTVQSLSESLYNRPTTLLWRNVDHTVAGNIGTMCLEMRIRPWICDTTQYIRVNIKQSLCLRCLHWCVFHRILMIWRHDKVVRQRRSRVMLPHSLITTVWWYSILYQTDYFL
jgi:hypothetical protein